jgi:PAS domain S-box-containing protein
MCDLIAGAIADLSAQMQTTQKRLGVLVGFGILLILILGNAFITRRQIADQSEIESWVSHTQQVLFELKETEVLLLKAESAKRAYLYTGAPEYLGAFRTASSGVDAQIDIVAKLTADNPRQQAIIPELRSLIKARIAEMDQTIALYQSGEPHQARILILTDTSRHTMDRIEQSIARMESEETSLDATRTATYAKITSRTIFSLYFTTALKALVLLLLANYILRTIGLREKHALELQAREEWFRVTLTSIGDGVIATDKQGAVTFMNPISETLTGTTLAQAKGRNIVDVFSIVNEHTRQPAENPVQKVMEFGHVVGLANHTVLKRKDGIQIPIEDSAAPIRSENGEMLGVILVFRDVTKERKHQELMRKTERLAAAARLSATMAHEINNPLQSVASLVYLAKSSPAATPEIVEQLNLADQELNRVAHITQQTLGFYRDSPATESVDLPNLIESVILLYANRLHGKAIRIDRNFGDCPPVQAVSGEVKQVISNLIANAADAVAKHGTITITLRPAEKAGKKMVQFLIEDDGLGIPAENMDHIFQPFFTTKQDVGTGLGLWLSKEIVERLGGSIEVIPRESGLTGAAFSILLPCAGNLAAGAAGNNGSGPIQA